MLGYNLIHVVSSLSISLLTLMIRIIFQLIHSSCFRLRREYNTTVYEWLLLNIDAIHDVGPYLFNFNVHFNLRMSTRFVEESVSSTYFDGLYIYNSLLKDGRARGVDERIHWFNCRAARKSLLLVHPLSFGEKGGSTDETLRRNTIRDGIGATEKKNVRVFCLSL